MEVSKFRGNIPQPHREGKGSQVSLAKGPVKKTLLISSLSPSVGVEPRGL